ncbi:unnamed protein product [Protopolystoma xenopodis]|uniref:Dolichyldiphosphatase n=1 Tax=Protopolystoma xenopodis TaxID=117903 RepID=A0A448WWP5_9PLAT|nr:unnamed protein product [Protopolystoma xenopodis]
MVGWLVGWLMNCWLDCDVVTDLNSHPGTNAHPPCTHTQFVLAICHLLPSRMRTHFRLAVTSSLIQTLTFAIHPFLPVGRSAAYSRQDSFGSPSIDGASEGPSSEGLCVCAENNTETSWREKSQPIASRASAVGA